MCTLCLPHFSFILSPPKHHDQIDSILVRFGERSAPDKGAGSGASKSKSKDDNGTGGAAGGKSPAFVGGGSPPRHGNGSDASKAKKGKGDGGSGSGSSAGYQPGATRGKGRKDWVRFDGAAMLLSSAGWSDDEDEEKEELITSEIEKFRQKQVMSRERSSVGEKAWEGGA